MPQSGLQKQTGSLISVLGEIMEFKVTGEETAGSFCVIVLTAFPHNGPPPHIHHREDESFYVLDGNFSFLHDDHSIEAARSRKHRPTPGHRAEIRPRSETTVKEPNPRGGIDFPRTWESLPISAESNFKNMVCIWTAEWRRVASPGAGGLEGIWLSR